MHGLKGSNYRKLGKLASPVFSSEQWVQCWKTLQDCCRMKRLDQCKKQPNPQHKIVTTEWPGTENVFFHDENSLFQFLTEGEVMGKASACPGTLGDPGLREISTSQVTTSVSGGAQIIIWSHSWERGLWLSWALSPCWNWRKSSTGHISRSSQRRKKAELASPLRATKSQGVLAPRPYSWDLIAVEPIIILCFMTLSPNDAVS